MAGRRVAAFILLSLGSEQRLKPEEKGAALSLTGCGS